MVASQHPSVAQLDARVFKFDNSNFSLSRHSTSPLVLVTGRDVSLCLDPSARSQNACPDAPPLFWWQPWYLPLLPFLSWPQELSTECRPRMKRFQHRPRCRTKYSEIPSRAVLAGTTIVLWHVSSPPSDPFSETVFPRSLILSPSPLSLATPPRLSPSYLISSHLARQQAVLAMQAADDGGCSSGEEGGWNDDLGEGFWAEADCCG